MRKNKGLTLIELLVIIGILGVVLSISISIYKRLISKFRLKKDIEIIYSFLNDAKIRSFTEKMVCGVALVGSKRIELRCDSDGDGKINDEEGYKVVNFASLSMNFTGSYSCFSFSKEGLAKVKGNIRATNSIDVEYDCINISSIRIRLGKWDGSSCEVE